MAVRYRFVAYRYAEVAPREVERLYRQLQESAQRSFLTPEQWRPAADVFESGGNLYIKVELAGIGEDNIHLTLFEDLLLIEGTREQEACGEDTIYYEADIRYGPFRVEAFIPYPIDRERVTAQYRDGFLTITLPRRTQ